MERWPQQQDIEVLHHLIKSLLQKGQNKSQMQFVPSNNGIFVGLLSIQKIFQNVCCDLASCRQLKSTQRAKLFKIKLKITALFEAKLPVMFVSGISLISDPQKRCLFNLIQAKKLVFFRILAPYVNRKKTSAIL